MIAGGDHVIAVITDDNETKNTVEFLHKLRSEMLVQLQQHLRGRSSVFAGVNRRGALA